jgi:hypothetical protein
MAGWAAAAIAGSNILGGMMASDAASESAAAQIEASKIAAESAKFKPYSLTTGFGKSFFDTEKGTAGYEIDPRLAAFRDQLYGQATQTLAQLGSTNPEAEAQKYVTQQMGLLQPTREAEDVANRQRALGSGRMGLGVSAGYVGGDGQGLLNPDQFATQLARERANAQIAAQGTEYGQNIYDKLLSRGTGMLQTGLGLEELGMKPLTMGADIGNKASISGAQAGQLLLTGASNAANANLAGNLSAANMISSAGRTAGGMLYNNQRPPAVATPYTDVYSANRYGALNSGYSEYDM